MGRGIGVVFSRFPAPAEDGLRSYHSLTQLQAEARLAVLRGFLLLLLLLLEVLLAQPEH